MLEVPVLVKVLGVLTWSISVGTLACSSRLLNAAAYACLAVHVAKTMTLANRGGSLKSFGSEG
jgi:hypothetical protein